MVTKLLDSHPKVFLRDLNQILKTKNFDYPDLKEMVKKFLKLIYFLNKKKQNARIYSGILLLTA